MSNPCLPSQKGLLGLAQRSIYKKRCQQHKKFPLTATLEGWAGFPLPYPEKPPCLYSLQNLFNIIFPIIIIIIILSIIIGNYFPLIFSFSVGWLKPTKAAVLLLEMPFSISVHIGLHLVLLPKDPARIPVIQTSLGLHRVCISSLIIPGLISHPHFPQDASSLWNFNFFLKNILQCTLNLGNLKRFIRSSAYMVNRIRQKVVYTL